jgi:hypothetical protein
MRGGRWFRIVFSAALCFGGGSVDATVAADIAVGSREEFVRAAASAEPGDRIVLAAGTYEGGITLAGLRGAEGRPIVIGAADPARPPVIEGGGFCLHLVDPAYVELRDLVLTKGRGNGLNIDDGGSPESPAHHVVLRNVTVRDTGSDRNHDGIKLSGLDDFTIEKCTVERWGKQGSGIDLVGCHRGLIVGSTFRDGDKIGANGVQMKGGSREITIRRCRFENAGGRGVNLGGSTGTPYFRPASPGYEAKDLVVEDSTFVGSMAPVAFVGVDGATVRHNTFYRPTRWLLRILQENQDPSLAACRNGVFMNNVVAFRSEEVSTTVNVGPGTAPDTFRFAGNLWYLLDRPEATRRAVRLPVAESDGVYGVDPGFRNVEAGDFDLKVPGVAGPRAE